MNTKLISIVASLMLGVAGCGGSGGGGGGGQPPPPPPPPITTAEAYQNIMAELDKTPIDEDQVLEHVAAALQAENEVKKLQVGMLVQLKNLLTAEQIAYLESVRE